MREIQAMRDLMVRVAPTLDLKHVTEYAEALAWALVFADEMRIDAEYDDANHRLILTGDGAAIPELARERAYETLLSYGYLWTEHGGVRAALDASTRTVVLMIELSAEELDVSRLAAVLHNFRGTIEGWRGVLAASGASTSDTGSDSPRPT